MTSPLNLPARVIDFCRLLRERDLVVTPGRALDAARSLALVNVYDIAAFRTALRANLTVSVDEYHEFDTAFRQYWGDLVAEQHDEIPDLRATCLTVIARIWPTVTTPVPPIPVIRMPYGWAVAGSTGDGSCGGAAAPAAALFGFLSAPPSTVTKLGQNPVTHEKSLLQDDWLIWRLRPSSVSSGSTDRQFDCTEQSPQPSHTASLMTARLAGSGYSLRLRRRRFSEAQVWS
jgi:hypothetical protein